MSLEALAETVRTADRIRIAGAGTKEAFGLKVEGLTVPTESLRGIISYEPDDRVVEVWAGTRVEDLQSALAERCQCLPLPSAASFGRLLAGVPGTVGGLVSMNLPHGLFSQCGGPKAWVLGAKVMRAGGEVVKSGGKVVKNVAGFDFHRFVVGARGSMGLIVSVSLKVFPIKSVPACRGEVYGEWSEGRPLAVQRVLPADYPRAKESLAGRLIAADPASCTLWFEPQGEIRRYDSDWLIQANCGERNLSFSEAEAALFRKAKQAVDPAGKFNPGVLGCL